MPEVAHLDTPSTVASQTQSRTVLLADSLATAIPRRSQEVACFSRAEQIHMMQARDERERSKGSRAGVVGVEPGHRYPSPIVHGGEPLREKTVTAADCANAH
jgi:hypothetical protein